MSVRDRPFDLHGWVWGREGDFRAGLLSSVTRACLCIPVFTKRAIAFILAVSNCRAKIGS